MRQQCVTWSPPWESGDGDGVISAVLGTCVLCTVYCVARTPGVSLSETVAVTTCEHGHTFLAKYKREN